MSALEILNQMARSDGERPFASADIENESDVLFRSFSDAQKAFQFTHEIKSKISIQVAQKNVPAEWTEMINAYPETQSSVGEEGQEGSTFLTRILASFGANREAWGGGFATACLVLILIDPSSESDPTLGAGIAASQGDALLGLRGSSVQATSQKIDTDTSSHSENGGLIFDLKERQRESCKDKDPASDTGKDVAKDVADICDSKSADK